MSFGNGVVTPHASFLALPYARNAALANLAKLRAGFDAYGPGGFYDAVAVRTGAVSKWYLALDQGMVMGALGNVLANGNLHRYFMRLRRGAPAPAGDGDRGLGCAMNRGTRR